MSFIEDTPTQPYVFLQWKGTDACLDFFCECGFSGHFDGYFAHYIRCRNCGAIYEMPVYLQPRRVDSAPSWVQPQNRGE